MNSRKFKRVRLKDGCYGLRSCWWAFILVGFAILCGLAAHSAVADEASWKRAPEWEITEWINSEPITLADLRGKVVVIEFFQLWCPGCNAFSIPLMREWEKKYRHNEGVELVSIHTVFEGHAFQTAERLKSFVREKEIRHPVGIDTHRGGSPVPVTMQRYRTGGTPEMAIVDKRGNIRFQHLGAFDPRDAEALIEELTQET